MTGLPPGWEWTQLGDIAHLVRGVTFKKSEAQRSDAPELTPIIRAGNVQEGRLDLRDDLVWVPKDRVDQSQLLRSGDIVVATSSGSLSVVGKSALVPNDWVGAHGAFMTVIRAAGLVQPRFIAAWLSSDTVRRSWSRAAAGTSINNLKTADLLNTPVPLAPSAEQGRIVGALEAHLSSLEAGGRPLFRLSPRLAQFKAALLQVAFDPAWPRVPITEVTDAERVIRYGILKPGEHVPGGVPVVKVRDYPRGEILTNELKRTSPEIAHQYRGATLRYGDVLISIRGTYGRVAAVPQTLDGANITQDSARIAPLPSIDRDFLVHFLRSHECQSFLRRVARGVAVKGVNLRDLRELLVPLPDIATQTAVASQLDADLAQQLHLVGEVEAATRASAALRHSVLAAAFSGKLSAQDPDDEPASALLEQIRLQRSTEHPRNRKRKVIMS